MSALPLFDIPAAEPKRVRETSRESLKEVAATLERRQSAVLNALTSRTLYCDPTSAELMRDMGVTDPNTVRPRLTELKDLRMVEVLGRRKCMVTGKSAMTWALTERGRLFLRGQK